MEPSSRVAYSPGEFAKLFGKSQTWGYREIYRGNVKAITEHGRMLIPAKEVERVLESAGIYNGSEKPKGAGGRAKKLSPEQKSIWNRFLEMRRQPKGKAIPESRMGASRQPGSRDRKSRMSVKSRIAKSWTSHSGQARRA